MEPNVICNLTSFPNYHFKRVNSALHYSHPLIEKTHTKVEETHASLKKLMQKVSKSCKQFNLGPEDYVETVKLCFRFILKLCFKHLAVSGISPDISLDFDSSSVTGKDIKNVLRTASQ